MFAPSRKLLEQYYCALLTRGLSQRAENLLHEVRSRLRILQWLHERILHLDEAIVREARAAANSAPPNEGTFIVVITDVRRPDCTTLREATINFAASDELRLYLESFYYFAHRIRDIFRDSRDDFVGMPIFEAVGIRDVRNHLVEHPTRELGNPLVNFSAGGPDGPKLKRLRHAGAPPSTIDAGLHANVREFVETLESSLARAIEQCVA